MTTDLPVGPFWSAQAVRRLLRLETGATPTIVFSHAPWSSADVPLVLSWMRAHLKKKDPEDEGVEAAPDASERRRWPRMRLALEARLRFASTEAIQASRTIDISPGGVFIHMSAPRPVGTPVRLSLTVGQRDMVLAGTVVRAVTPDEGAPPGIAVRFTEITADDRAFLQGLLPTPGSSA